MPKPPRKGLFYGDFLMSNLFLHEDELKVLTGRKHKSRQIEQLRSMGIPFRVNATGHPVVTRGVVEGRKEEQPKPETARWSPRVVGVN